MIIIIYFYFIVLNDNCVLYFIYINSTIFYIVTCYKYISINLKSIMQLKNRTTES